MNQCFRGLLASCLLGGLTMNMPTQAQLSPAEALDKLNVAEGMEISLFASEPMLRNPTSIDVDAQGPRLGA